MLACRVWTGAERSRTNPIPIRASSSPLCSPLPLPSALSPSPQSAAARVPLLSAATSPSTTPPPAAAGGRRRGATASVSWRILRQAQAAHPSAMSHHSCSALLKLAPLEAVLFDIDGTLCDSDPLHFQAFRDLLQQVGFNNGEPITEEFYSANISGGHNDDLARALFPELDHEEGMRLMDQKEAMFRKLAPGQLKAVDGLHDLCSWIQGRNLKRAAVTNAPRPNAELMLSLLGLADFFPVLVIGSECDRAKPFPDPYLKALHLIDASPDHTFVFEDSASGVRAGVAAGVPVVGLTTRNPEKALTDAGASLLIKDFQDPKLLSMLQELHPTVADKQG